MRRFCRSDYHALVKAMTKLEKFASVYPWCIAPNFDKALDTVFEAEEQGNAYVVDGYLVLVDKLMPWYSTEYVLQEWLVLKLYDNGDLSKVPLALEAIAKTSDCKLVMTADSSPVNIMAKAYNDAGFSFLTQSFYKRVP